ncbi:MAG: glycosyl transferase [Bacteroidota bacterium]|nr:glycosyl transferase [Bacteroidota bacterium]
MKILYAIQGTGNGHISRARDIIPILQKKGTLDILVSGTQADVDVGYPVKYKLKGMSFIFGKKGGVDLFQTYKQAKLKRFYKEIHELPVEEYDLIINDFEPVSAWACKIKHKECIGLSHQAAVLNKKSPCPVDSDIVGKTILKEYAPVNFKYGFHFKAYDKNIFTPVIRSDIRNASVKKLNHYTVYLPAYEDERIIKVLKEIKHIEWQVFSKHSGKSYKEKNVYINQINNRNFVESLITSTGVLCGAGFETPAEALFLQKKLMVIPMKGQYEQQCNAAALKEMGVPVLKKLKPSNLDVIKDWVDLLQIIPVDFPDITEQIIDTIFEKHLSINQKLSPVSIASPYTGKKIRKISLSNVLHQITG